MLSVMLSVIFTRFITSILGHESPDLILPSSSSSREAKSIGQDQSPNPNQITDLNQVGFRQSL
jgi:hypothetical protein